MALFLFNLLRIYHFYIWYVLEERKIVSVNFCDPHWELICHKRWLSATSEICTPSEIAVGTHFMRHMALKLPWCFYLLMEKLHGHYFPTSVSLLPGGTVQLENTYSFILEVTGQVWESQKWISINTNHCYHQHSSC